MKRTKRVFSIGVAVTLLVFTLSGCGIWDFAGKFGGKQVSDDVLSITYNPTWSSGFLEALQEEFPDITFEAEIYVGNNTSGYTREQALCGDASDIFFTTAKLRDELQKNMLMDLSTYEFSHKITKDMWDMFDVEGGIYLMPGPIQFRTMVYNRTLFAENGWKVPRNHDELVAVVRQIREERDITPIAFHTADLGYYFTSMTTLAQAGYLSTEEGLEKEQAYLEGKISSAEIFDCGIRPLQELIDANAYDISETENCTAREIYEGFANRDAAMIAVWGSQGEFLNAIVESEDEFGNLPFYGENGDSVIGINISGYFGLNKRLAEKGNGKKLENALRVMNWITTSEALATTVRNNAFVMPLVDVGEETEADFYKNVLNDNATSYKAFMVYTGYTDVMIDACLAIKEAMRTGGSLDGVTALMDKIHQDMLGNTSEMVIGEYGEDFTAEETAQFQVNLLAETGLGDFALLSQSGYENGIISNTGSNGKIHKRKLTEMDSLTNNTPSGKEIVVLSLTGEQVKNLLQTGKQMAGKDGRTARFDYFCSGISVEWENGEIISVKWNGDELNADDTYRVLFAKGDYSTEIAECGNPENTGVLYVDIYREYLERNSPVMAP